MKRDPRIPVWILVVSALWTTSAQSNSFTRLGELDRLNSESVEWSPTLSPDGTLLIFSSNRPGGRGGYDLYMSTRSSRGSPWGDPRNLGPGVNSTAGDLNSAISADGLRLYFYSNGRGGLGQGDIFLATRADRDSDFMTARNLTELNSGWDDYQPTLAPDELQIIFVSDRPGQLALGDFWVSTRATVDEDFSPPVPLEDHWPGSSINTLVRERGPSLTADGLALFLSDGNNSPFRAGGVGAGDIWVSLRASPVDPFPSPINLNELSLQPVNSTTFDGVPSISADWPAIGSEIYFISSRNGWDLWMGTWGLLPSVSFSSPETCVDPGLVSFDASASTSPEGSVITRFEWDFGDGETLSAAADEAMASHRYEEPGLYVVRLEVRNDLGFSDSLSRTVCVRCPPEDVPEWSLTNLGPVDFEGTARRNASDLELCAGGRSLTGRRDEGLFVYQAASGNLSATVRVSDIEPSSGRYVLGIMLRASLDPGSAQAAVAFTRQGDSASRHRFRYRATEGGNSRVESGPVNEGVPEGWLRVERRGEVLIGLDSADGETWTEIGRQAIALPDTFFAGVIAVGGEPDSRRGAQAFTPLRANVTLPEITPLSEAVFLRGDCDGDGTASGTVTDALHLLQFNFLGGDSPTCLAACDADGDGRVEGQVTDAVYMLAFSFLGGPPPAPPYPNCGPLTAIDEAIGCGASNCR